MQSISIKWLILLKGLILLTWFVQWNVCTRVRVVTWNTGDNNKMKEGFTDEAMDKILGKCVIVLLHRVAPPRPRVDFVS